MSGQKVDYQVRVTAGIRKINGRLVEMVHEHISVPFPDREAMQEALASSRG